MPDSHILYELLVYNEWNQETELASKSDEEQGYINWFRSFDWRKHSAGSQFIEKLVNHTLPWRVAVGADGRAVALIQDSHVEIRSSKDEYSMPLGKANLWKDPFPQWRQATWSPDDSMLAIANSNGSIEFFDLLATPLFTIENVTSVQVPASPHSTAIASLVFTDVRTKSQHWNWELLVLSYTGVLKSFYVSPLEKFQLTHEFSFTSYYPCGVTALALHSSQQCLYVAGVGSESASDSSNEDAQAHGITAWRILNDAPYYKPVLSIAPPKTSFIRTPSLLRWKNGEEKFCVWKMVVSHDGKQLVAIHNNGLVSIWALPSLKCQTKWPLASQDGYDELSPALLSLPASKRKRCSALLFPHWCHPTDVNWWNSDAVIVARFSGAVSVYAVSDAHNLLGASPEFFDGVPQISAAFNGCFLGLECESKIVPKKKPKIEGMEDELYSAYEHDSVPEVLYDEDDEEESTLWKTSSNVVRSALYWVTDSEKFQPPRKRAKMVHKTYRLLALKRTTPADLYARKLDEEEYGEALALARAYGLDCDLVYQRQWRNHPVSVPNIQHYLSKISKRSWVLKECLERVPDDPDAARELLLYGLKGTDAPALYAIGQGKDGGYFITTLDTNHALEDESDEEFSRQEAERKRRILSQIDWKQLNLEQRHLIETRRKLLQYLDRLALYELILGGPHRAGESFDSQYFARFRAMTALEAGAEFARNGQWSALALLWTYEGQASLPHRLPLLSCFPETTPPFQYRTLLPECDVDGQVYLWEQQSLRPLDWCESEDCKKALMDEEHRYHEAEVTFYESDSTLDLAHFKTNGELSGSLVSQWYVQRSRVIELRSGQIEYALDLVRLGRERNVEGLDEIYHKLVTLETLVYELDREELTLEKFERLSDIEIVKLLLSKCIDENLMDCLNRWLLPYLRRCESLRPGSRAVFLREYLVNESQRDLTLPVLFVEHSKMDVEEPIIESVTDLLQISVDCLYAYTHTDQLSLAFNLYDCLPERGYIREGVTLSEAEEKNVNRLHDVLDEAEKHLEAAQLLEKHGVPLPLVKIRQSAENAEEAENVLHLLNKNASQRTPPLNLTEWKELLQDELLLQQKVFKLISPQTCQKYWIKTLLSSRNKENMKLAASCMDLEPSTASGQSKEVTKRRISHEESVKLVLEAAQDYFDTSEDVKDPALDLCGLCLQLIPSPDDRIQEELNLVLALQSLHTYGLNIPPLRIRHTPDRLSLVQQVLQQSSQAYKNISRLLHLARVLSPLGIKTPQLESQVLIMVAQAALNASDFEAGYAACQKLMAQGSGAGWEICTKLSRASKFKDKDAQMELVNYALCYCPPEAIEELLTHKRSLDRQNVEKVMKYNVETLRTLGVQDVEIFDLLDDDVKKPVSKENGQEEWNEKVLIDKAKQTTKQVMETTAQTTKHLLDTVKRGQWKEALMLRTSPQRDQVELGSDTQADYHSLGLPLFYHTAWRDFPNVKLHSSRLEASYTSYSPPRWEGNIQLQLLTQQLRLSLLKSNGYFSDNPQVVLKLAQLVFAEDVTLALGLLMTLHKPSQAWEVFLKLPTTELTLQIAAFYFALQVNQAQEPEASFLSNTPYQAVVSALKGAKEPKTLSEAEYADCKALLDRCCSLLADVAQARQLRQLDSGVDVDRFAAEDDYKKDTIVGLAITTDSAVYSSAVKLAQRYGIPLWEVTHSHLMALILEDALPVAEVERRIVELDLLNTLLDQPNLLIEKMESGVFPSLNGQDYTRLLFYYRILDEAASKVPEHQWKHHLSPSVCINMLNKLKNLKTGLDWKKLISGKKHFLREIKASVTNDNVSTLAKLAQNCDIRPGAVYAVHAQKAFFQVNTGSKGPQSLADWSHRYESLHDSVSKIDNPKDFLDLISGLCFSDEALSRLNVEVRREVLKRAAKHARQMQNKEKDLEQKEAWDKGRQELQAWMEHVERISSADCEEMRNHADPVVRKLFRELDQSRSEAEKIQKLLLKLVLDQQPVDLLKQLIAVLPPELAVSPEDVLMDALHLCLNHLSGLNSALLENVDVLPSLGHVLEEIQKGLDDGGPLGEEDVLSALRDFTENDAVDVTLRLGVLAVVPRGLTQEDWAGSRSVLFKTISLLQKAWPSIDYTELKTTLDDSEERYKFFRQLLDTEDLEEKKLITLVEILQLWPTFSSETRPHPWLLLGRKALESPVEVSAGTWNLIIQGALANIGVLPAEALQEIYQMVCSVNNLRLELLIALKARAPEMEEKVLAHLETLTEVPPETYDEEILALALEAKWEARLVKTPLYPRLMAHVLTLDAAAQSGTLKALEGADYRAELGAFIEQARGVPRGLLNFAASLLAGKPKK